MARYKNRVKIEDFGEKIGGAKKDYYALFKEYKFTTKDIEGLNYKEVIENINKKTLLIKPDYVALAAKGLPLCDIYLLKRVYDKFPTTFVIDGKDEKIDRIRAEDYVTACKGFNDIIKNYSGVDDLSHYTEYLVQNGFLKKNNNSIFLHYYPTEKGNTTNLINFIDRLINIKNEINKAIRKVKETNFPYNTEKRKESISEREKIEQKYKLVTINGDKVAVVENKEHGKVIEILNNYEDAKKFYEQFIDMEVEKARKAKNMPVQLSLLRRVGKDYTDGKDVTPEMFMQTFHFRGVEFGNWNNINDRQENLNWAYNSLLDLAELLQVSPDALSLNGKLALAFGSRGSGRALAHYESARVVINLTKMHGAGSLAHEWMHALDDYLGRLCECPVNKMLSNTTYHADNDYAPIYDNMLKLINKIKYDNVPYDVNKKMLKEENEQLKTEIFSIIDELKKQGMDLSEVIKDESSIEKIWPGKIKEIYKSHVQSVNFATVVKLQEKIRQYKYNMLTITLEEEYYNPLRESRFYKTAKDMPQKYWSRNEEMLARAFESYIDYTLRKKGLRSDYLQSPVLNKPMYFTDKDIHVFEAFKQFFESLDVLDRTRVIKSDKKVIEQEHVIEKEKIKDKEKESQLPFTESDEQNPAIVEEEIIEITKTVKPINKEKLKESLLKNTVSTIVHNGEKYILYPAYIDGIKNYSGFILYNSGSNKSIYDCIDDVVDTLAEAGVTIDEIKQSYKVMDYEILPGSNNCHDIIQSKNTFTARITANFEHRIDNINVPFLAYKKGDMIYVTSYKEYKDTIVSTLRKKDREIGRVKYKDLCNAPGENRYIELSQKEYEILQLTRFRYSAFEKGENINVVIKEKDFKNMLTLIGRDFEGRIATRSYVELRDNGFTATIPYDEKDFIETLKRNDIRYCGIEKNGEYVLLIHNDDKEKYNFLKQKRERNRCESRKINN